MIFKIIDIHFNQDVCFGEFACYKKQLEEFDKCTVKTENKNTKSRKTFDWNLRDSELTPVVYLDGKVAINEDGTVNLAGLDTYCKDLFENQILRELRPDRYVD